MSTNNNKILNLFELNEESSQILKECAKNNITSTNTESINLKMLDEIRKGLKLEMDLIQLESEIEKANCQIREELKEIESLNGVLSGHVSEKADLKTVKMIEKLGGSNKELQTPSDVNLNEIINKVKKLQK